MDDARELMRLHVETLFTCDDAGRLLAVNEPGGGPAPRFFLGRTADGNAWWFRNDLSNTLTTELHTLCTSQPADVDARPDHVARFAECISRDKPVRRVWAGPAFRFPTDLKTGAPAIRVTLDTANLLSPHFDDWREDVAPSHDGGRAGRRGGCVHLLRRAHDATSPMRRAWKRTPISAAGDTPHAR